MKRGGSWLSHGKCLVNLRQEIEHLTPALRRLAQGLVDCAHNGCDDLVQETLLRALRFEKPVKGIAIQHWLYAILVGIIRQNSRSLLASEAKGTSSASAFARQIGSEPRTRAQRPAAGHRMAGDSAAQPVPVDDIRLALQALALEEREVLALVVLEGLNYSSAAAILGLPRPTLIARLARARASLSHHAQPSLRLSVDMPGHLRLIK